MHDKPRSTLTHILAFGPYCAADHRAQPVLRTDHVSATRLPAVGTQLDAGRTITNPELWFSTTLTQYFTGCQRLARLADEALAIIAPTL